MTEATGGRLLQVADSSAVIERVLIDSRQVSIAENAVFFAIEGDRKDGHSFIPDLYHRGVRNFVVSKTAGLDQLPKGNFVAVESVVEALQKWSRIHRQKFDIPVIGITGSNGKTIVKEWLSQLLATDILVTKSPKSYNSQLGVPLSVLQLDKATELGIFEAGISMPGEMNRLQRIIMPQLGIFTNIGSAHDRGFDSWEVKAREKAQLFREATVVVCCHDHRMVLAALQDLDIPVFTWSMTSADADLFVEEVNLSANRAKLSYVTGKQREQIELPFTAAISLENALHCLCMLHLLEVPSSKFVDRFKSLQPVAMRLESLKGTNGCQIINDVYNADLESIQGALAFAEQQTDLEKRTIILSDLQQMSGDVDAIYRQVAGMLEAKGFSRLIGIGADVELIRNYLPAEIQTRFFTSTNDLLNHLTTLSFDHELILVKGARSFHLEELTKRLSAQRHSTVLEINLSALARNLKRIEGFLNPETKMMVMVKAAAYGSGAVEVSRLLSSRGVDYLAVAYPDEGLQLRLAGIDLPILVLNPEMDNLPLLVEQRLEPEIFSLDDLSHATEWVNESDLTLEIHLKLDSGMHRQGIQSQELDEVIEILQGQDKLIVKSVFSHLAASEDAEQDEFTSQQCERFLAMSEKISQQLDYKIPRHILNSNGIVRFPQWQLEMVRLGIGAYGIGMPNEVGLEPVHTLKTNIAQIKEVKKGSSVGYGRAEYALADMRIGIVRVGYADGLIRKAGNRRYALMVRGKLAPIVGQICMDVTMIDLTGLHDVMVGDQVIVFGEQPGLYELAQAADTIPYEVFTNISERVKRIYIYD